MKKWLWRAVIFLLVFSFVDGGDFSEETTRLKQFFQQLLPSTPAQSQTHDPMPHK